VEAFHGVGSISVLAPEDAVYDLLCEADTVGVFQVESRAQMATLPRVRPTLLLRPRDRGRPDSPRAHSRSRGESYIRRRRGDEPVTYLHPSTRTDPSSHARVPLFQEQLMEMAVAVAGFSPAEADELRQAMAAKRRSCA